MSKKPIIHVRLTPEELERVEAFERDRDDWRQRHSAMKSCLEGEMELHKGTRAERDALLDVVNRAIASISAFDMVLKKHFEQLRDAALAGRKE